MALSTFNIINISQDIAERSVALRQEYSLSCRMPSFWRRRNSIVWN